MCPVKLFYIERRNLGDGWSNSLLHALLHARGVAIILRVLDALTEV